MSTEENLIKEAKFHDSIAEGIVINKKLADEHHAYDSPASYIANRLPRLKEQLLKTLGDPINKRVLVYGCGNDSAAVWFSKLGAKVDAIDISPKSVRNQQTIADLLGLKMNCIVMDANNLDLPTNEYDIIYGNAILHHLDIDKSSDEIARVLKCGGKAVFRDVMRGNIFLQIFRIVTPFWRTDDEHPLTLEDFTLIRKKFTSCDIESYILSGLPYFFFVKIMNNVFFKRIGIRFRIRTKNTIYANFDRLDERIFSLLPFTRNSAWLCLVTLNK